MTVPGKAISAKVGAMLDRLAHNKYQLPPLLMLAEAKKPVGSKVSEDALQQNARLLEGVDIEPLDVRLAKIAGDAIAAVRGATTIDAIVMASAAQRGDTVFTSDVDDLTRLAAFFRGVRVLAA